mgnify:CR=1 FL=1
MNKLSIGLIGYGIWGSKILNELLYLDAQVHVFDSESKAEHEALKKGATSFHTDLHTFKIHDFKGLIIASSTSSHVSLLQEFANSNFPIFVEKPLTNNIEDLYIIQKLNLTNVYIMHIWKYHPGVQLLASLAKGETLGDIKGVKSIRANWTSPRKDTNSLWNLAIHDLSICETILGFIPEQKQAIGEKHQGQLRGVTALLGNDPFYHFEVSNRYPDKLREIRVFGTKAVAILKDEKVDYVDVYIGNDESVLTSESLQRIHFDSTPPLRIELKCFLDYLNGGTPPPTDLEEGIRLINHLVEIENLLQ